MREKNENVFECRAFCTKKKVKRFEGAYVNESNSKGSSNKCPHINIGVILHPSPVLIVFCQKGICRAPDIFQLIYKTEWGSQAEL